MTDLAQLSPEQRLLVQLAQRREVRARLDAELTPLEDARFRERVARLAIRHGIHGLVWSAIVRSPLMASLSATVQEECRSSLAPLRRQAIVWDLERDHLLSSLARLGMAPVVLKGGALRSLVYDDPVERSIGDLDLLLPDDQIDSAVEILQKSGYRKPSEQVCRAYRRHHFHLRLTRPGAFPVELHWALSRPGGSFRLDSGAFLARAVERPRASGPRLRVPSPEDMILHMASQNVEDAFGRLRRIVDLDRILAATPQLDWDYLRRAARHAGIEVLTAVALRLADILLGAPVPPRLVETLGVPRLARLNLALFRAVPWVVRPPDERDTAAAEVMLLWTTVGWRRRLRRCLRIAGRRVDPLAWAWQRDGEGAARRTPLRGLPALGMVAAHQAWMYLSGIAALFTRSGRRRLRFWTASPVAPP